MDLTKSQKKKVRELIDIGLDRDYTDGIQLSCNSDITCT
jgi:hypothetical protein